MTTFLVELVILLIILWLIMKYIWPALNKMMIARQEEIRVALASAEAARQDAENADGEREAALEAGKAQAAQVVEQATRNAEQVTAASAARASAEYDRIIASAHAEVALSRQRAVDEAASQLGDTVMSIAEQVIAREFDGAAHASLVNQAVGALDASATAEGIGETA